MNQWAVMREQADVLVKSGFLPKAVSSPEAAIAIMQTGREFGLEPMESFRHIHIINGAPTLAAGFMAGMVQSYCEKRGGYLRQAELTDDHCTIEYMRATWPEPQRFTFSMADAKKAGLAGKDVWQKNQKQMLYNRAVANACRMGWPDLVSGVYDPEELESLQPAGQDEVIVYRAPVSSYVPDDVPAIDVDGEVVDHDTGEIVHDERPMSEVEEEYYAALLDAESTDKLDELGRRIAKGNITHPTVLAAGRTRRAELEQETRQPELVGAAAGEAGLDRHSS
jgi:hypothetical protein